jgi:alpha 1,3-glucosidase
MQPGSSPYVVLMDTLKVMGTSVEVQLVNRKNNIRLLLQVSAVKDNSARVKINEMDPIKKRYEIPVGDALVGEPKLQE